MSMDEWGAPVRRPPAAEALSAEEALVALQDHLDEHGGDPEAMHAIVVLTSVCAHAREALVSTGAQGSAPDARRTLADLESALDGALT